MWGADKGNGKGGFESYGKGKGKGKGKGWGKPREDPTPVDLTTAIDELQTTCMDLMADDGMLMRAWNQVKKARALQQQEQGIVVVAPAELPAVKMPKVDDSMPEIPLTREERKERSQQMLNQMFELLNSAPANCMQADELLRDPVIREARKGVANYFKKWVQMYPDSFRIDDPEEGKTQYTIGLLTPFAAPPEALDTVANARGKMNKRPYRVAFG